MPSRQQQPMSLTTFVDFVKTNDAKRLQMLVEAVDLYEGPNEREWDPRFYKPLGDKIGPHLLAGSPDGELRAFCTGFDRTRRRNYLECAEGWLEWSSKRRGLLLRGRPKSVHHELGGFTFNISPELDLTIGQRRYWIKLYFKADALKLADISPALDLMDQATRASRPPGVEVAILDLRHSNLLTRARFPQDHEAVLRLAIANLGRMWPEAHAIWEKRQVRTRRP